MLARKTERGQSFIEYGLLLMLIALVVIIVITLMGTRVSILYSQITSAFP
jgi:pilus assembly protein Flp/PilA